MKTVKFIRYEAFNRTAYGIEIEVLTDRGWVRLLLIAPLMELKYISRSRYAVWTQLLIAPLMELK